MDAPERKSRNDRGCLYVRSRNDDSEGLRPKERRKEREKESSVGGRVLQIDCHSRSPFFCRCIHFMSLETTIITDSL